MKRSEADSALAGKKGIFHISSDHLEKELLFSCEEDFVKAVNALAIIVTLFPVKLLCYCLMDNHVHLLLMGLYVDCILAYDSFMKRVSMQISQSRGITGLIHYDGSSVVQVLNDRQFRNEVMYILRNPYKARICSPYSYRWSSIDAYFSLYPGDSCGKPVTTFTVRELRSIFGSRNTIFPASYRIRNGCVTNRSFVDYAYVEKRIGSSLEFFDTLRIFDLESTVAQFHGIEESITYSDQELRSKVLSICRNEYHCEDYRQLDRKTTLILARTLARRFGSGKKQIARVIGMDMEVLDRAL